MRSPYGGFVSTSPAGPIASSDVSDSGPCSITRSCNTPARSALATAALQAPASRSRITIGTPTDGNCSALAAARTRACIGASAPGHCSIANSRASPGAMRRTRSAASMPMVPDPQNGSTSGTVPFQSQAASIAAASVSRSGAFAIA